MGTNLNWTWTVGPVQGSAKSPELNLEFGSRFRENFLWTKLNWTFPSLDWGSIVPLAIYSWWCDSWVWSIFISNTILTLGLSTTDCLLITMFKSMLTMQFKIMTPFSQKMLLLCLNLYAENGTYAYLNPFKPIAFLDQGICTSLDFMM